MKAPSARSSIKPAVLIVGLYLSGMAAVSHAQTSAAATVVEADGAISVLRDAQEWALFAGDDVEVGQTIISGSDGWATLAVSDGSSFLVYPNSRVVFRKNPGSLRDLIDIFLGRVKVHIERLGGQPNPTRIYTPTAVISVRGTTFEVEVEDSEVTTVSVEEGLVGVRHKLIPSNKETLVSAGQSLIVDPYSPLAKSGMDGVKAAQIGEDALRVFASIWRRLGNRGGSGGGSGPTTGGGGSTTPLPTDEEAPAPPPAPPPPQ